MLSLATLAPYFNASPTKLPVAMFEVEAQGTTANAVETDAIRVPKPLCWAQQLGRPI